MNVHETIDRIEYLVTHSRRIPLTRSVAIDEDEAMELLDALRLNLPDEIKQANWTVQEQQRLISEAHAEASRILGRANERAEGAVQEHEVLNRAERLAQQTVREAQARADQTIREAEAYALEQLQNLEAHLSRTLATVKRGVETLQPRGEAASAASGLDSFEFPKRSTILVLPCEQAIGVSSVNDGRGRTGTAKLGITSELQVRSVFD